MGVMDEPLSCLRISCYSPRSAQVKAQSGVRGTGRSVRGWMRHHGSSGSKPSQT